MILPALVWVPLPTGASHLFVVDGKLSIFRPIVFTLLHYLLVALEDSTVVLRLFKAARLMSRLLVAIHGDPSIFQLSKLVGLAISLGVVRRGAVDHLLTIKLVVNVC